VGGPPPQRSEVAIDGKCENESARASGSVVFEIDFWFFCVGSNFSPPHTPETLARAYVAGAVWFFRIGSRKIADKLDPFATKVGEQFSLYGIGAKISFRCLLKCLARRNKKKAVTDSEFKEFLELIDFMNFGFKQM
jgi:hypothetical protein